MFTFYAHNFFHAMAALQHFQRKAEETDFWAMSESDRAAYISWVESAETWSAQYDINDQANYHPIESGTWDKVITACKGKIDAIRKKPIGPKKQAQLEFYSDAGDHCLFMKDIWRNNISHTRKPYNKPEALAVLERVRDFMKFLAANNV